MDDAAGATAAEDKAAEGRAAKSPAGGRVAAEHARQADLRRERLAAALRENLKRRKQQARERREPEPR